jgi:hypothetical protein
MPEQFPNTTANNVKNMCAGLGLNFYFVCKDKKIYRKVYTWYFHKVVLAFTETLPCNSSVALFVREQCFLEGIWKRKNCTLYAVNTRCTT